MRIDWPRASVAVGGCGRVRCEPGWRLDEGWGARLVDCDLWFVWAGRGEMRLRERTLPLRPGVCVWMRPGGRYLAEQDPADRLGVTYVHFDVRGPRGRAIHEDAALPAEVHDAADVASLDAVLRRVVALKAMRTPDGEAVAARLLSGVLMELDAGLASPRDTPAGTGMRHRRAALDAAQRIAESPADAPPVAELARRAGYSADHFARLFREVLGQSPQAYVVQARIDRARQLLAESSLTVTQIAEALGYRDVYFFSRQFRQKVGRTPTAYRDGRG